MCWSVAGGAASPMSGSSCTTPAAALRWSSRAEVFKPFSGYGHRLVDRGLGLVLAQRIVQRLGGSLSLRVVDGRGSIYTIELPRLTT